MTEPGAPAPDPEAGIRRTEVDEGRPPPPELAETVVDPGRENPGGPASWTVALPPELASRYRLDQPLSRTGGQADLYLVTEVATGVRHVIKHYRTSRIPAPQVRAYLESRPSPNVVRVVEFGRDYEVMEYLAHGDLIALRQSLPSGLDPTMITTIVRQVSAVLTDLHRGGIVHRDVKPTNVLLRSREPLEVVLVDLGISTPVEGQDYRQTTSATLAYAPPEWVSAQMVSPKTDWWGLGITIVELATGRHPLEGLPPHIQRRHLGSRPINVSGVDNERIRLLCQGLLLRDDNDRWGSTEVGEWLAGRMPTLPPEYIAVDTVPGSATIGFPFNGKRYHHREFLATALATGWEYAAGQLFGDDGTRLTRLRDWLDQFQDELGASAQTTIDRVRPDDASAHVRLLRVIRALDPTQPPVFRNLTITPDQLPVLAHRAIEGEQAVTLVLSELWRQQLLPLLATAGRTQASPGGTGLAEADARWRQVSVHWRREVDRVREAPAREELDRQLRSGYARAVWLLAATGSQTDHDAAATAVRAAARDVGARVAWFAELAARPDSTWVAFCLVGLARAQHDAAVAEERAARARREALLVGEAIREWSRRQNRPLASAWAVGGVAAMAVVSIALITIGDAADLVDDSTIAIAWMVAAVATGLSLVIEVLLALDIGGRFHPRYSMPGAGGIALGRAGALTQGHGIAALGLVLAALAGIGAVTVTVPVAVPIAVTVGHVLWAVARYRAWSAQVTDENNQIEQARRDRLARGADPMSTAETGRRA